MRTPAAFVVTLLLLLLTSAGRRPVTIFVIGDSTAAQKDTTKGSPERGWGMMLQEQFDRHIRVENHAVNGRSSKSFIDEGRWQKVLDRLRPGDYVIIQFGHNDEKPDAARHTDPGSTFDDNLRRYISETREHRATPILMNAVVRRNFFRPDDGSAEDEALRNTSYAEEKVNSDTLIDTHGDYARAPRRVAEETGTVFVDANRLTHDLEQGLGVEGSRSLHMWFRPGEHPAMPKGRQDNTHYNIYGARVVASMLADAIAEKVPRLRRHRK
ncbi:MAG: rhamnogalacturonan acetylesterase [Prevotella sp.]|nr:rhamnogalacturonan acetylesterase [Prevotella sp.]